MKVKESRPFIQVMFFVILIYGAFIGLRFPNFMPMFLCHNASNYSFGCFLLPLHNLQYGLSTFFQSPAIGHFSTVVPVPSYQHFWIGGEIGVLITVCLVFIVFILLFNNLWCGWACPFGTLQDWMTSLRTMIRIKRIWLTNNFKRALDCIKIIFIMFFVSLPGACLIGFVNPSLTFCNICPVRGIMTLFYGSVSNLSVESIPGPIYNIISSAFSGIILALIFFCSRFFCLVCPIIGLAGIFNKFSFLKIKKDISACNGCGSCVKECPMDLKEISSRNEDAPRIKDKCIQCYHCVEVCPRAGALSVKFLSWKFLSSQEPCKLKKRQEKL